MAIIMVAMVDADFGIGDGEGNVLFGMPKHEKHFNQLTSNKHVVMGKNTWESLMVKPLPKRKNYILTHKDDFEVKGKTKVFHSIEEVLILSKKVDVYIIGGGEIYEQFLPHADKIHLTHVHYHSGIAQVYFPELPVEEWGISKVNKQEPDEKHPVSFSFAEYNRKQAKDK